MNRTCWSLRKCCSRIPNELSQIGQVFGPQNLLGARFSGLRLRVGGDADPLLATAGTIEILF